MADVIASHAVPEHSSGAGQRVAVIGLGSMGSGMAQSLVRSGFDVSGFDVQAGCRARFKEQGMAVSASPSAAVAGADIVVCVVVNAEQTDRLLFGKDDLVSTLKSGAVFVSCATMAPDAARSLAERVQKRDCHYLDAPISGGAERAAKGQLSILASGGAAAFAKARPALEAMSDKIYELGDEPGMAAAFKMINQLLAGVHIAAACEAITFAAQQKLDLNKVYEVITASAGNSWMFENRVPHVLAGDYRPLSSVDIFVKDLGIVQDIARSERFPTPLAAAALQLYLGASGAGMGGDDDSSLARIYAQLSGAELPKS